VYPDGPQDAESLLVHPVTGRLYLATKSIVGGTLYVAPKTLSTERPNALEPVGEVLPIATDGAFFPDGRHLVVRDYGRAAIYTFPAMEEVARFRLPDQQQGEGITVAQDGTVYVSSEGQFSSVLRVALPAGARRALAPAPTPPPPSAPPSSSSDATAAPTVQEEHHRPGWVWVLGGVLGLVAVIGVGCALRRR
jgi:hypothetical protein